MEMRVVIVGAGSTGRELASRLAKRHPVMLVDTSTDHMDQLGDPVSPEQAAAQLPDSRRLVCVRADGTSRLVLRTLFDPLIKSALIAVAGTDEANLETGRLGREIGFEPIISVMHGIEYAQVYSQERISAIDRAQLLADQVEQSLRHSGALVPSGIGLGQGELVEIRLVRTSPVIDRPLKNLAPHHWRIAAVFRGDELIVPTGDTTLQVEDRVLLVGDPKILPTVAEYLRLGTPQFPRPYGPNVVTLEFGGPDDELAAGAERIACESLAVHLVRGQPDASDTTPEVEGDPLSQPTCAGIIKRTSFRLPPAQDPTFARQVVGQRPGLVVVRPKHRSLTGRILGLKGDDAALCDQLPPPILFARELKTCKRILLPVSDSDLNIHSAEMAIDITRQLGASLTAVNVDLPRYISGLSEEQIHREVVPIRRLCELYEVPLDYSHHEGNPVHFLVQEARKHDLVVVARRHNRRDNYFNPDVAMRLARKAGCSVLVLTVRPEG